MDGGLGVKRKACLLGFYDSSLRRRKEWGNGDGLNKINIILFIYSVRCNEDRTREIFPFSFVNRQV
jgi:hypothetical protein